LYPRRRRWHRNEFFQTASSLTHNTTTTKEIKAVPNQNQVKYVPAGTGPMYSGPGDRVSFLATGAETQGSCFIFEGLAAPG
jgi:hypothetical protein